MFVSETKKGKRKRRENSNSFWILDRSLTMFSGFNGDYRRKPVINNRGASKKESKEELLKRVQEERQKREVSFDKSLYLSQNDEVIVIVIVMLASSSGNLRRNSTPEWTKELPSEKEEERANQK